MRLCFCARFGVLSFGLIYGRLGPLTAGPSPSGRGE
jgi:hypothetical protein